MSAYALRFVKTTRAERVRVWIDGLVDIRSTIPPHSREHFEAVLADMREAWRDELALEMRAPTEAVKS